MRQFTRARPFRCQHGAPSRKAADCICYRKAHLCNCFIICTLESHRMHTHTKTYLASGKKEALQRATTYLLAKFSEASNSSKKLFFEIFSGSGRVAKQIESMGHICIQIDICNDIPVNVAQPDIADILVHHIMLGCVSGVWLGTPCKSWLRRKRGRPLRTTGKFIWGHPDALACPKDRRRIKHGNILAKVSYRIIYACHLYSIPWAMENPRSSLIWKTPAFLRVKAWVGVDVQLTHMCVYGERYKRSTHIMSGWCEPGLLSRKCTCEHAHEALIGEARRQGDQYPMQFAADAAVMLTRRIQDGESH